MRIMVVANPGAGKPEPVLSVLNDTFGGAGIDWDVAVTHASGDGYDATRKAVDAGYDLIAAYGGDGTVAEVASALALGGPPMVILPGGTGNGLAEDLGVSDVLNDAACLVANGEYDLRDVDMGRARDGWFILRLTMGFEASAVEAATRQLKDRFGWLAYTFAGLRTLTDPPKATYRIDVDDESVEVEGLACLIANSASSGVMGVKLAEGVDVSDGLLDVIVIELADLPSLAGDVADAVTGATPRSLCHWRGRKIRVESQPVQPVLADGEESGTSPVEVCVVPNAIRVVVPKADAADSSS